MNKNWARWIFASISKYVEANRQGIALYIEGLKYITRETDFFELRIDGPRYDECSKDNWKIWVDINILIQVTVDESNFHVIEQNIGIASQILSSEIPVYRYGPSEDMENDNTLLECLQIVDRGQSTIRTSKFGKVRPDVDFYMATVDAQYVMTI